MAHFQDDFTFTLAGNGSVSVWIKDDREPSSHINNLNGRILVFASGAVPTGSNTTGTDLSFTVTGLSGGIGAPVYTLRVAGDPTNNTPKYIFGITAVPLPPAAILFGSVLVGLATMARRRWAGESA